ncbi:MAG TPA: ABC transporter permease [Vicinamibacterales bacterium]|nr:ABC transporter permease [Vicinamibacterales bacterium]
MERLLQDLRFASRLLWKDRGFATTAIITLAVCIGANATIFAVVNAVLLQPLPVRNARQLVYMYNAYPGAGVSDEGGSTGVPDYYDRLKETDVFQEQALYNTRGMTLGGDAEPQRITAMLATPSLLRLLQVQPIRGRLFMDEEGEIGKTHKVVLTYASWQQWFGGQDNAVGRDVRIGGEPYTVVGILPRGFSFLEPDVKVWVPVAFTAEQKSDESRHSNNWSYVARLKPGATVEQARQQIDALNARNLDRFPKLKQILINAGFHTVVVPLQAYLVRDIRNTLYLLWGGVVFVLLVGAVNVTNLMLVRSSARTRELATRHALGAGLARIARQLLTETVVLSVAGALLGLALAYAGVRVLSSLSLDATPQGTTVTVDGAVVAFTFGLALALSVLIGLVPILSLRHLNLSQTFRQEGRSGTASRGARVARRSLVTAQIAFAFMLLIGAGLLLASFQRVLAVRPGFDASHVLTGIVSPPAARYKDDAALRGFWNSLLSRVRALPGVNAAGIAGGIPLGGDYSDSVILAEGYAMSPGESLISPYNTSVSAGYFEAMSIPLKRGRLFADSDDERAPSVVIVDERLATRFWKDADPIGRRMWKPESAGELTAGPGPKTRFYTVVGVVGNVRTRGLTEKEPVGMYYFPFAQNVGRGMTLVTRTAGDPSSIAGSIRQQVRAIDPELPFFSVKPMQQRVDESLVSRKTPMLLASLFGGIALFLAAIGIYGVLAYQVAQRRKEIGIRIALGSDGRRIFGLIVSEGLWLLGAGVGVGLGGAFVIRKAMETQLFGVQPMDPVVLAAVAAVLGLVAFAACAVPARRAARIDPLIALND